MILNLPQSKLEMNIPKDILRMIIKMLNPRSFCNLRLVSKSLKERCDEKVYQVESSSVMMYDSLHISETCKFGILGCQYHGKRETTLVKSSDNKIMHFDKTVHYLNKGVKEGPSYRWIDDNIKEFLPVAKDENLVLSEHYYNDKLEGLCRKKIVGTICTTQYKQGVKIGVTVPFNAESLPSQMCKDENHTDCVHNTKTSVT